MESIKTNLYFGKGFGNTRYKQWSNPY